MNGPYSRTGFSAYQSSKTAINRFAEFLSAEYGSKGVRAFAYHPGKLRLVSEVAPSLHSVLF